MNGEGSMPERAAEASQAKIADCDARIQAHLQTFADRSADTPLVSSARSPDAPTISATRSPNTNRSPRSTATCGCGWGGG